MPTSSTTTRLEVHVSTLCRGTVKFTDAQLSAESIGQLKERLVKKLHVQAEDIRIIQAGCEVVDAVSIGKMEAVRTVSDEEEVASVKLFMVLKSTSTASVTLQVKDSSGPEKHKYSLTVNSGMRVDDLKARLNKEFKCALPVQEQKLICCGRVMTNACVVGEYLPLNKRTTLLLLRQPDSEKEVTLRIRMPGAKEVISLSFTAKTTFATIRHVVARSRGIPCDTVMFQVFHNRRRMDDNTTLLSQNILKTTKVYLLPGVPVQNPATKALVYTFPEGHFDRVFGEKATARRRGASSANVIRSHQPVPTRKPKVSKTTKGRGSKSKGSKGSKGGLFSGLKKGFFDKRPMTPEQQHKTMSRTAVHTPKTTAAISSLRSPGISPEVREDCAEPTCCTKQSMACPNQTLPTRRCMSFKDLMTEAMAPSSPVAQNERLEKHKKQLAVANPAVLPKKIDSI
jgi:hypothetical protein